MKRLTVKDGYQEQMESVTEMCHRLIHLKTEVNVPDADVSACHASDRHGADSTHTLRIHNRKPNSA